jgi:ubiquinone/menaquinone biosynthesis C-methylase UbiE
MNAEPTERFSDRVDNYVKYRPSYPPDVIDFLANECRLEPGTPIADVGSGTGIFSKLLLDRCFRVYAVEPNAAMQHAAREQFKNNTDWIAVNGTAEATTLPDAGVSLVVCAQAFHWFDATKTKVEFARILTPGGRVALIWNNRQAETDEFAKAYETLLKKDSVDYNKVNHRRIGDINFKGFFKNGQYELIKFPNEQVFDEAGLMGRAFSSSYVPPEDTVAGQQFKGLLKEVFEQYNKNGQISFQYQTEVYIGEV